MTAAFANAAIALLTDDALWQTPAQRRALARQRAFVWTEAAIDSRSCCLSAWKVFFTTCFHPERLSYPIDIASDPNEVDSMPLFCPRDPFAVLLLTAARALEFCAAGGRYAPTSSRQAAALPACENGSRLRRAYHVGEAAARQNVTSRRLEAMQDQIPRFASRTATPIRSASSSPLG